MEREERLDRGLQCSGSLGAGLGFNPKSSDKSSKGFVLACRIFVPLPEIEPVLLQWKHGFLTTGSPGKSIHSLPFLKCIHPSTIDDKDCTYVVQSHLSYVQLFAIL